MTGKFELVPDDYIEDEADQGWNGMFDDDECHHEWVSTGINPDFGTIYECSKCFDRTP